MLLRKLLHIGFKVKLPRNNNTKIFIDDSNPDQGLIITYPSVFIEGKINNTYQFSINLTCQMNYTETEDTKFDMSIRFSYGLSEKFTLISMKAFSRYGK